jgi:N-acetylglucosamine-6-phosphate deacetylase
VGFVPGSGLASSVVGLDTMVRNMAAWSVAPLHDVVRMASLTPAERAGIAGEVGSIEPGKRADIVILDRRLRVQQVFNGGVEVDSVAYSGDRAVGGAEKPPDRGIGARERQS